MNNDSFKNKFFDFNESELSNNDFLAKIVAEASVFTSLGDINYIKKVVWGTENKIVMNYFDRKIKKISMKVLKV